MAANSSLGLTSRRFPTILFGISVLGLFVAGCDRVYPPIVRNGHSVPIVITTVFEDGTEGTTEVPSMGEIYGQYGARQISPDSIGLFASVNQSAMGQEVGKRVIKQVRGVTYRLATGDVLMTYPRDQDVIIRLNAGGINHRFVSLISPNGVFDIPEELQERWQDHISWIERVGRKLFPTESEKRKLELPASAGP
jgi:hypothetical protein